MPLELTPNLQKLKRQLLRDTIFSTHKNVLTNAILFAITLKLNLFQE